MYLLFVSVILVLYIGSKAFIFLDIGIVWSSFFVSYWYFWPKLSKMKNSTVWILIYCGSQGFIPVLACSLRWQCSSQSCNVKMILVYLCDTICIVQCLILLVSTLLNTIVIFVSGLECTLSTKWTVPELKTLSVYRVFTDFHYRTYQRDDASIHKLNI